jgi:outer membrane protein
MKLLLSFVTAVCLLLVTTLASADSKIAVIDVQQILQKSPQMAAINDQLTKQFKPRQDKLAAAQKALQDESDNLNRNAATMNVNDRNKLQDKILADKANFEASAVAFRRDLADAQNRDLQGFMNKLSAVVNSIAKSGNYDLILQRSGVPYAKDNMDITAQVLKQLG